MPTDSPQTLCTGTGEIPTHGRQSGQDALATVRPSRTHRTAGAPEPSRGGRCGGVPRSPGRPTPSPSVTLARAEPGEATFQGGLRRPGNRSWRSSRGKCTDWTAAGPPGRNTQRARRHRRTAPTASAEFRGSTLWSHPFASKRFHVLLNSLFKVLFNFPSRYLFAIGLVPVFSLRWSLPPS